MTFGLADTEEIRETFFFRLSRIRFIWSEIPENSKRY